MWFVVHNNLASFSILLIVLMQDETVAQKEGELIFLLYLTLINTNDR